MKKSIISMICLMTIVLSSTSVFGCELDKESKTWARTSISGMSKIKLERYEQLFNDENNNIFSKTNLSEDIYTEVNKVCLEGTSIEIHNAGIYNISFSVKNSNIYSLYTKGDSKTNSFLMNYT